MKRVSRVGEASPGEGWNGSARYTASTPRTPSRSVVMLGDQTETEGGMGRD